MSGEAIPSAEYSGKLWVVVVLLRTPLGEITVLPQTPSWWGGGLLPVSAFGLDFRPFGPDLATSTNSLHFTPMLRVWIKHCFKGMFCLLSALTNILHEADGNHSNRSC